MYTENQIKQLALSELGHPSGLDFTSTEDEAVIKINASYDLVKRHTLSRYRWGFALPTVKLDTYTAVTDNKYTKKFEVPTDFLNLRTIYRDVNRNTTVRYYELYDGYIYCNEEEIYLYYSQDIDEDKMPDYFVEYLKIKLAFDLCFDLTGDTKLLDILATREKFEWINATNIDARQRSVKTIKSSPFTAQRLV